MLTIVYNIIKQFSQNIVKFWWNLKTLNIIVLRSFKYYAKQLSIITSSSNDNWSNYWRVNVNALLKKKNFSVWSVRTDTKAEIDFQN